MKKKIRRLATIFSFTLCCCLMSFFRVDAATITNQQRNLYEKVFDYWYYSQHYPDVVAAVGNNSEALMEHYITTGMFENRNASEFFNLASYANRYPELLATFGTNMDAYVEYYVKTGAYELQNASDQEYYITPTRATNIINRLNTLVGTCTTVYNPDIDRAINVEKAANNINGIVLQPKEVFSYNRSVGPRTTKNGFVEAPIFLSGKHGTGIGGGICQVSSTLYAALINANITPIERHEHSLPVTYLPAGFDATISGDYYDLKFANPLDVPIQISAIAENGFLTITLIALN